MSSDAAELDRDVDGLPDGWRSLRLGDVTDISRGTSWGGDNERREPVDDALPVLGIRNVQARLEIDDLLWLHGLKPSAIASSTVQTGDILMVGSNGNPARIGNAVQVDEPGRYLYASLLFGLRPRREAVDPDFLYFAIIAPGVQSAISDAVQGTTGLSNLKITTLRDFSIDLPPLDEQRRIAEVLRSVDEAIAAADLVARQWATTLQTLLEVAFAKGEPASLGDICSLIYRYPGFYGFDQLEAGVPVIRGEHLRAGRISRDWADFYFVDPAFSARFPKTILELDDVVMSVRGTVGTTAIVDAAHVGSQISPNLIRLVADPDKIVPPLLYYAVQSAVAHMRRTIVNAQALPAINAGDLKQVEIALPPLADQPALLAELNGAAAASANAVSAAQQTRQTKAVVMSDLLSGRVRVPA